MSNIHYDAKYDILYLRFSDMSQSCGEDVDGLTVMRDHFTNEITGVTILDFMRRLNEGAE